MTTTPMIEFQRFGYAAFGYAAIGYYVYSAAAYQNTPDDHPANRWRAWCCWGAAIDRGLVLC